MRYIKNFQYFFFLFGCIFSVDVISQDDSAYLSHTKEIAAGAQYDKVSALTRVLFGEHYRKDWAVPVKVEIFDFNVAGGLTPTRLGGGKQTKTLRLIGKDGKEYVLRSVEKDPSQAIPKELIGTVADDIVQDQISSSNPYAPLVISALAEAAGILHTNPKIVFVPDLPILGEFRKDFANTLCLFEERPVGNQEDKEFFGFSKDVVNSERMIRKITEDSDFRVDQRAFLLARLFDMWIGDWDRHEDQWSWASYSDRKKTIYKPIPKDRDQAFSRLDGIIPQMASKKWAVRKTQNFGNDIPDVIGLNMVGVYLDRNLTNELAWKDWLEAVEILQQRLTDEVIESSVRKLPENIFAISGEAIIKKLKNRRAHLDEYAIKYYQFLSDEVDIAGTYKNELVDITRLGNDSTEVIMHKLNKNNLPVEVYYRRVFYTNETKEIRIYGIDGSDNFRVMGKADKGILVRIIGGHGRNVFVDSSVVKGATHKTKIYDTRDNEFLTANETRKILSNDTSINTYNRYSYAFDYIAPKFAPGYNPDDGIFLGGGLLFRKQRFRKLPYGHMQAIWANYAFATGAYNFWYAGHFIEILGKWNLRLNATLNAPNYVFNFFGEGNETKLLTEDKNFNRVRSNQFILSPALEKFLGKNNSIDFGLNYQFIQVDATPNRFTDSLAKLQPGDFGRNYFGGVRLGYHLNTIDNPLYPKKGIEFNTLVGAYQHLKRDESHYTNVASDFSLFLTAGSLTAAIRLGGATNLGDRYEFYQANTLGGTTNLRGYRRTRFSGKSSFFQNADLRLRLASLKGYIFRGDFGILAFADNGRVWVPGEVSKKWHSGFGGGLWYIPYNKLAFTVTYGVSEEDSMIYVKSGFLF